jgi:Phosphoserine phosphatase
VTIMLKGEAQTVSADAVDVNAELPRVVLFDFDGVLMHGDAFYLFMRERYRRSWWRSLLALLSVPLLLPPLPFSRRLPARVLVRIALLGLGEQGYQAAANAFAASLARRPRQFCRDGLQALRRHQAQGDRVIVVTGCEHTLVSGVLQQLGLTDLEILASQLRIGWLGVRPLRHNVGRRKVQALAAHGVTAWQVAYGDSMLDVAMLKPATEAVLVNGTPALCKKIEKALGRSITRVEWF